MQGVGCIYHCTSDSDERSASTSAVAIPADHVRGGDGRAGRLQYFQGARRPVGAPVSSGGGEPLSIVVSGNLVYVANAGASAPNITGFILAPNGSLNPLPGSTVSLPSGSGPDDVLIDPRGWRLVVDLDNTSTIASFHVRHDGLLAAVCLPTAGRCW
jgi:hypothetical protein